MEKKIARCIEFYLFGKFSYPASAALNIFSSSQLQLGSSWDILRQMLQNFFSFVADQKAE